MTVTQLPPPNQQFEDPVRPDSVAYVRNNGEAEQSFSIGSIQLNHIAPLNRLSETVDSIMEFDEVRYVSIDGSASIDGPERLNEWLARQRAEVVRDWLGDNSSIDKSIIEIFHHGENWPLFRMLVSQDEAIPGRDSLFAIIDNQELSPSQKEVKMRSMLRGETWAYLARHTFPKMRRAAIRIEWKNTDTICATIDESSSEMHSVPTGKIETVVADSDELVVEENEDAIVQVAPDGSLQTQTVNEDLWQRKLYLKTNAPAWLMLWTNLAVEVDIAPHWSLQLPVYYSGFDYFRHDVKFRTLAFIPEGRWWTRSDNTGLFLNAHFGLAWYNYAKGGAYRYQDHNGSTPAIGGGVGVGYRFHFCRNRRWTMEAGVGAGVYRLDYDIFANKHNGLIEGRRKRTFFGLDQAALSFSYSFGLDKKGGKR